MKIDVRQNGQGIRVLALSENQCVWAKAGVVNFKTCDHAFDCTSCAFDKEISREAAPRATAPISWREAMGQPHLHKECRHMLTGRVLFKLCSHNYACKDCAYDQTLYEYEQLLEAKDRPAPAAVEVDQVAGFLVPILDNACAI